MKRILTISAITLMAFLLFGVMTFAQTTSVSGVVADATTQAYAYGTFETHLIGPPGYVGDFFYNGTKLGPTDIRHSGALDSSGSMGTVVMYSSNKVTINGGQAGVVQWQWTVCSGATSGCYSISLNITGATYSITGNIVPPAIKVPATIDNQPSAYSDSEIVGGVLGFTYFNLTDQTLHICGPPACTWIDVGGSGVTGFNTITSGTNTSAAMVVGSGASLTATGSGTISATGTVATPTACSAGQAATGINSSFASVGCFTPTGSPAGSQYDIQTNNGSGGLGSGVTGQANVGLVGNIAVKPASTDSIRYVSPEGNDANDCRSEGSACKSVYQALIDLPGGAASPPTSGRGTVYVLDASQGTSCPLLDPFTSPTIGLGFMDAADPNYLSPPNGWLRSTGWISVIGITGDTGGSLSTGPSKVCVTILGTQPTTALALIGNGLDFENLSLPPVTKPVTLGYNSNGINTGGNGTAGVGFKNNLLYTSQTGSSGPTMTVGQNVFQVYMERNNLAADCNQTPGADNAANILFNAGAGGMGMPTADFGFRITNEWWYCGGGVKYYAQGTFATISMKDVDMEGTAGFATNANPGFWLVTGSSLGINIQSGQLQDYAAPTPYFRNDTGNGSAITVINVHGDTVDVQGAADSVLGADAAEATQTISPLQWGQSGIFRNRITGLQEAPKRTFSPVAVRFTNLAITNAPSWTNSGNTTFTSAITAPDGTTGAGQFVSTSGIQQGYLYPQSGQALSVGDFLIGGAWVRSQTANGYDQGIPLVIISNSSGTNAVLSCMTLNPLLASGGDGSWEWVYEVCKVTTGSTGSNDIALYAYYDTTHTLQVYGPVFNYIASGTVSANEVYAYANGLVSYDKSCVVGTVCGMAGQTLAYNAASFGRIIDTALTPSANPICPGGAGGAFTTTGCTSGSFYQTVLNNGVTQTQEPATDYIAGSNMTIICADSPGVKTGCTFTSSATAATSWSAITSATNSNAGTFIASGNAWDFSAATSFKVPTAGLTFPGSGSGNATVVAQATAGTPTLTLPNASGTFAVSASAPLVLSATTGNMTVSNATTGAVGVVELTNDFGGTGTSPTVLSTHITGATTNRITKFSSGNLVNTAASEASSVFTVPEILDTTTFPLVTEIANEGATGTTVNKFASLTGAPSTAIITSMGVTGAIGIVAGGAGTTGSAQIATSGQVSCVFDGATTAGHFVTISATVNGDCTDNGTTAPASMPTVIVLTTNGGAGTYAVSITGGSSGSGSGSGTVNNCATSGAITYYATNGTAVSCLSSVKESAGVIALGTAGSVGAQLTMAGSTSGVVTIQPQNAAGTFNFNLPITAGTSGYFLTSGAGGSNPMTWTANTFTLNTTITCTVGGTCLFPEQVNTVNLTSQAGFNLLTSTANADGLTVTPTNPGTNQIKFEISGTNNSTGGGTGVSNPAAHSLLVTEGSSNMNLVTSPSVNGTYLCGFFVVASAAVDPACNALGVPVNAQTGTSYTLLAGDRASAVSMNNASPVAVTLPQAGSTGFAQNYPFVMPNIGAGLATITPTTSTINGASTLKVPQYWVPFVYSDNANYTAYTFPDYRAFANTGANSAVTFNSTTGAFGALSNIVNCAPSTAGDVCYWNGSAWTLFGGNTSGTKFFQESSAGVPSWQTVAGSGTVTSVGLTVNSTSPSGIFTITGSPVTTTGSLNFNLAGTSGGVPYFSSSTVLSSSAALTQYGVVYGGGAGVAPVSTAADTTTTHALFATATAPAFRAIVAGDLPSIPLNQVISPTGAITEIQDGDNALTISAASTTSGRVGVTFSEHTASTSAGTPYETEIKTLIGSTASPLKVDNSLNGSQTLCAVCILPTWNTTGVVDAALLINPTNTASGTGSLLIDAQTGGTSEFSIDKSGNAKINVSLSIAGGTALATTNQTGTGSLVLATSPTFTSAILAGTDNSTAGTLQLSNSAANAHTIWGSAATASNTILGPATVVTTLHEMYCVVSSTTCTLTDTGYAYNAIPSADISALAESKLTGSAAATTITETGTGDAITRSGVETGNSTTPYVFINTNSTNNNTSIGLGVSTPGTSTGQTTLNVNGASTGGDLADFGTGGSWSAGVLSGQTILAKVTITGAMSGPSFTSTGTTAGFIDFPQGSTSAAVAPCNVANSGCFQAPAAVTAYVADIPAAAPTNNFSAWLFSDASPSIGTFAKMPQTVMLTSQYTNSTTGFTNVTGTNSLAFSLEANTTYQGTCTLYYQAASTGGLNIEFTGPASPTFVTYSLVDEGSATTIVATGVATAYSTSLGAVVTTATTNFPATVTFGISNGANAGTLQMLAKSSASAQLQIQTGSYCVMQ